VLLLLPPATALLLRIVTPPGPTNDNSLSNTATAPPAPATTLPLNVTIDPTSTEFPASMYNPPPAPFPRFAVTAVAFRLRVLAATSTYIAPPPPVWAVLWASTVDAASVTGKLFCARYKAPPRRVAVLPVRRELVSRSELKE
jgi:hypothetical protein